MGCIDLAMVRTTAGSRQESLTILILGPTLVVRKALEYDVEEDDEIGHTQSNHCKVVDTIEP